jgi:SsrA-binding protein
MSKKPKDSKSKNGMLSTNALVADNRRARFDYHVEDTFDAGIELVGTEVKSLRLGQCSLNEAHVSTKGDELFLFNAHIPEYQQAGPHLQHEPRRIRRLLLHRREINKMLGAVQQKGYTIVPLKLFFNKHGKAKLLIGLAKGKKQHDKRETIKQRDWSREKQRLLKDKS